MEQDYYKPFYIAQEANHWFGYLEKRLKFGAYNLKPLDAYLDAFEMSASRTEQELPVFVFNLVHSHLQDAAAAFELTRGSKEPEVNYAAMKVIPKALQNPERFYGKTPDPVRFGALGGITQDTINKKEIGHGLIKPESPVDIITVSASGYCIIPEIPRFQAQSWMQITPPVLSGLMEAAKLTGNKVEIDYFKSGQQWLTDFTTHLIKTVLIVEGQNGHEAHPSLTEAGVSTRSVFNLLSSLDDRLDTVFRGMRGRLKLKA